MEHINISLILDVNQCQLVDLRIPTAITVTQLQQELNKIFQNQFLSKKPQMKIKNKGILLEENQRIKNYPITNGDIIEILGDSVYE